MAKFSFGSGEFGGGGSFGSGGSFSGKSGNGERRSPSIVAESLDEERLKPYLEGYQEYLSTNPDDEEGAQLAGEDKLFTWENEHQSMLPLAGKVIQTGLKGVGINLPNIFEDYKGIPALQLGTGNTELNMDLESLSQEDQKKYIEGYTNYRNRHPDAKEDDLNAHLAGQSAVRSGWYENRWNKEPEESKEQKLPEFWMPGGATRFEDLAPEIIEQLKNPQEQSKESPFQFGAEQTEVTDEKVRSTLEKIQGQLSELGGNGTVQETYAMQADANALSDYLNGITDDQDSVRPILDKWNIGNYQNALGQNQQQEEQQSAFTFSAEQTEVTDDAVRGTLSKIQERLSELGGNGSAQETYAMQADANALNDYLNGITDDPESVRPILEKWKAGNNLSELGKPEPNIWQKALTEKTMQDMRLALGLLTGEDNIDLSQMNTPALDALAGTASSAHEAIVNARNAFFASFQEGLLSAEESAAWLGFNLSTLLRLDGPVRAVNEWMISNALGHNVDLSGFNLLSEGFEGWAGAAQGKQQQLQADSDALKEAARPEMESVLRQFMSEQDAKTWTETILTDLAQGTGQTFGSMYPGMISMYTSAAGMLGGAGEAGSFIGRVWDALRQPGSWSVFVNEAGQATKEARQRYGEGTTDWDLGMALVTGLVNTAIENYETKLGRGIQSIIEGGSFPGLASLITSGLTEMLEEGKQKFTGDLNQDIADVASGRTLTHKLSFTEEEALFNVADYLDLCGSTYVTSVGLGVAMGGANLAAKPYRTAVENVLNGTATPEEARMAAEAAEVAMADQEAQRQAGTVETPTTEEQHKGFKAAADGENRGNNKAAGGTDARAEAAVEEAGADAWDEEQDYKCEQFVLEELERAGAPQEQIDAQRAVVNEKLEAWNRAKAAPAEAREETPAPAAPAGATSEYDRARQEFLDERDKMLELERKEASQEELDAQQAILDQKKAAMDQAAANAEKAPEAPIVNEPAREDSNLPPAETDVRTAEQRMREAQAAEVQAIIASNDQNVPAEERARRAQEARDASARRAAAEEEYRRAQAAADAAVKNQNDQVDLRNQEEQRAQQAQDEARKAELRLKRAQEARQQAEEAAKQQGLQARERAEAEKKAGIARRQERRAQEAYNKALKAADEQNRQADARKASEESAQNSIDQMNGLLQGEVDQTNRNAQDIVDDQNRQAAERLRLEEEARAAELRMQEARAEETQAIIASNDPDVPPEERARREQEARDAMGRREEAENEYREAQAAVDALESKFVPTEEPAKPEDQESKLVDQEEPEQPESKLVPQEKPEEQKSDLVPMDEPAKQDDQVGTLVEDEAGEAGDGEGNAEEPKAEEPLSTLVEKDEGEQGEGESEGSAGETPAADEGESQTGVGEAGAGAETEEDAGTAQEGTGSGTITEEQKNADNINRTYGFNQRTNGTNGRTTYKPGLTINSWSGDVSDSMRTELQVIHDYAKEHGFAVVMDSTLSKAGIDGTVNGFYKRGENGGTVIHLAQDGTAPLRTTLGHELYHMLSNLNKEGAAQIEKLYREFAARQGVDVDTLVNEKLKSYRDMGVELDPDEARARAKALEEVIADSMYDVIGDERTMRALAMQDRSMAEKIRDWAERVLRDIRKMIDKYGSNKAEAKVLYDQANAMENMRAAVEKALAETDVLREGRKAAKSLGSNSEMLNEYHQAMDAATSREDMNAATLYLAGQVLDKGGVEANWDNMRTLITAALEYASGGGVISQVLNEYGMNTWIPSDEANRAFVTIGRYVHQMLQNQDEQGYLQLMGMDQNEVQYALEDMQSKIWDEQMDVYYKKNGLKPDRRDVFEITKKGDMDKYGINVPIVFDPKQVKSADPITYDNDGKPIPLSERFNDQEQDIRWSVDKKTEEDGSIQDVKDSIRYAMDADDAKDMLDLGSDMARTDQGAWGIIDTMRQMKLRQTQDADGNVQQTGGYWKKMAPEVAKSLREYTYGKDQKTIEKAVKELFSDLDAYQGDAKGFVDYAMRRAQETMRDLYADETENPIKENLKAIFDKYGPLYVTPEQKKELQYYAGGMTEFRRQAAGMVPITNKKSGIGLEEIWSELAPMIGADPDITSVGTMIIEFNDAIGRARTVNGEERTLMDEEIAMLDRRALDLVAEYMQAGATVVPTRAVEKIDADRHQQALNEVNRLEDLSSKQQDEIDKLTKKLEDAEAVNQSLNRQVFDGIKKLDELKKSKANMDELNQAREDYRAAQAEANESVKAMKDLQKKLDEARAKRDEYRKELTERNRALKQETERSQRYLERLTAAREQQQKQLEKMKQKALEARAKATSRQARTNAINNIRKTGGILRTMFSSPSEKKGYIPMNDVRAAADLVESLVKNDGRTSAAKMSRKLENALRDARESTDYRTKAMYDDGLYQDMQDVTRLLEDKGSLRNLSDSDLEFVNGTLTSIVHQIRTANETIGRQKNQALSDESADMIKVSRENPQGMKGIGRLIRKGILTHLNPQRYFAIMGHHGNNAWTRLGDDLSEAQRKANKLNMDMTKNYEGLTQGENEKKFDKHTGKNATWYDTGIHILNEDGSDSGRTWKMNGGMRAYFALAWGSEQNREGMRAGMKNEQGQELYQLTIPDEELMKKGNQKEAYARGERVYFTEADAKAIIGEVTGYEQSWMNSWRDMEKLSKNAINETSLLLNGFRKATVDNYVPIFRDPRYIGKEFEAVVTDSRLTSMGFLKERVNAHNPMMLMDLTDVIKRQVRDVSTYYGFAVPVRNATRIYNGNMPGYAASVKEVINKTQGMEVGAYFEKLMADLQGGSRVESSPLDKLRGNVAGAVLSGNPSVIIKQAASYPAAASVLGWKPLLKGLKYFNPAGLKGINVDKIDQYTSALWERRSRSLSDLEANANRNTRMSKTMHWLTNGIQGMDVATTKVIWKAAEYYVDEHNPDLSRGTDEYNRAVARIYEQALEGTQPEYGTMQRPGILRNQSQLVKSLMMYKTQSLQNFNILVDAATNLSDKAKAAKANNSEENQAALKAAKRQMATALSSQITSAVILGVMTAVGKALLHKLGGYRDDKGDLTAESVGGQILKDSASSVAGMVAGGSELFDLINGLIEGQSPFDIEAAGVSTINDLYQNFFGMVQAMIAIGDEDKTPEQKFQAALPKLRKFGLSITQMLGLPVGNFLNLIDGIAANAADFATGKPGSFATGSPLQIAGTPIIGSAQGRETSNKSVAGYIAQAMMDGDQAEAVRLYNEQIRQGKSADALNTAIATWQKANIPEIRQAAEAIDNGDLSLYNQLINELVGKGLSMTNAVKYVEAERKKLGVRSEEVGVNGPETAQALSYQEIVAGMTKETKTSEENSYTNGMMNSLLEDGNVQAAMAVRDDMLANGKTKSSISSSLSSFWKPRLQEAYAAGDMVTVRQITQMLVQMGLKHTTIQGWTSSTGTSSSSSSSKKSSFGSGSFGGGSFGNSNKKKSGFGSGSFGGKGFGK